ncbi:MAG: isocitrate lyase/PEP mutase family protein [Chloroflexota bacterium]|nr:isocitrate lyase/PEP mutase family protein [Chloroflexota bacterium]
MPQNAASRFRERLQRPELIVMPGGFSPLLARMAELAGFESYFVAGSQTSGFLYGLPDVGVLGLRDMVDHARHIAARCSIPIMVDGDTGYGNAVGVYYAVQEMARSGVAAMSIEDQEAPKKSATSAGRRCISKDEAIGKYRAAVAARNEVDADFLVCARCDVIGAEGGSFEEALDRSIAYVHQGGVDFVWLNSVQSREHIQEACARIPAPVLPLWGGGQPAPTLEEYQALGARIALFPVIAASAALQAAWEVLNDFKQRGVAALDDWGRRSSANPWGPIPRDRLLNSALVRELEDRYLPQALRRDYDHTFGHGPSYRT